MMRVELSKKDVIKKVVLPSELTHDLAYLCGILAGDGHINIRKEKHDWLIKCVGNPKNEVEFYNQIVKPLFKRVFGLEVNLRLQDGGETYGFCMWSRSIVSFLTNEIGLPHGSKYSKLKIPIIFRENKLIEPFIRGVADTDFYLGLKRGSKINPTYPVIAGASKSKSFRDEIADFLEENNIKLNRYTAKQIDTRFKDGFAITYRIEISGHENFKKWMSLIGFGSPKHLIRAGNVLNSYKKAGHTELTI